MTIKRISDLEFPKKDSEVIANPPNKIGEFIDCILTSAVIAHKFHLKETGEGSFARHLALEELYKALPEHADEITEKYQGYTSVLIGTYPSMDQKSYMSMQPLEFVTWLLDYVEKERVCFGEISSIQNLVDELIGSIASTKYKLTFLS